MTAVMKYIIDQNKDGNGISIAYYLRRRTEQSISFITWQFIKNKSTTLSVKPHRWQQKQNNPSLTTMMNKSENLSMI